VQNGIGGGGGPAANPAPAVAFSYAKLTPGFAMDLDVLPDGELIKDFIPRRKKQETKARVTRA
jgi:hypothetical protein